MSSPPDSISTSAPLASGDDPGRTGSGLLAEVVWHDLECGSYRADLPLWRELAAREGGPILDVGAGSGRVAIELADAGHNVTALDIDPDLLGALRDRADGLPVQTVCADARSFELPRHDFSLCLVPMQTIQLLEDVSARAAFLRRARAHLRPGALLACAIVTELESFDVADGSPAPSAETARVGEALYISQAESVRVLARRIVIGRSRRIVFPAASKPGDGNPPPESRERDSGGEPAETPAAERNVIELARLDAGGLKREGSEIGFRPEPALVIEPTEEHVGSVVVMLRA
ncbi:MAG TPA: methyltransferase domain-containing protein [Solirubrobacteraceae bacterium]